METTYCVTARIEHNNWVEGDINGFRFWAKVFDTDSKFGINHGRVSKLLIQDEKGREIVSYDRGWDKKPACPEHDELTDSLIGYFKFFPTSAYFQELSEQEPFIATIRMPDESWVKANIHVSPDGTGTIEDVRSGHICGKLNPVDVWELKMQEDAGYVPNYEYPLAPNTQNC